VSVAWLKHEVGNVGPRDFRTTVLADVADAVLAPLNIDLYLF
jgi:hypothetical protein